MKQLPVTTQTQKLLGFAAWGIQLLALPSVLDILLPVLAPAWGEAQKNFIYHALSFLLLTAALFPFLWISLKLALERPFYTLRIAFYGYVLYWVSFLVITWILQRFVPDFQNINDDAISQLLKENYPLTAIVVLLLAPIAEELVFRGLIFGTLHPYNAPAAYILSAAAFASIHVLGYLETHSPAHLALCFLQYIPAGLTLAWVYGRTGTIWAPIVMHIAINQTSILSLR